MGLMGSIAAGIQQERARVRQALGTTAATATAPEELEQEGTREVQGAPLVAAARVARALRVARGG
eukprot:274019-Prymnesium_polylepis.2